MNKIPQALKVFLSVVFLHCLVGLPAHAADSGPWKAVRVAGDVVVQRPDADWRRLAVGDSVSVGDRLRTGRDGELILARDDERVTMTPNSVLHVQPGGSGIVTRLFQKVGTMMFKVRKKARSHFEVRTPYLVAVVRGTQFTVAVHDQGGSIHVTEGLVEVAGIGSQNTIMVHPGKTASIGAKKGSKVQLGITPPAKSKPSVTPKDAEAQKGIDKQSRAPTLRQPIGAAKVNISERSNGLLKRRVSPADRQLSARGTDVAGAVESISDDDEGSNPFDQSANSGLGNAFAQIGGVGGGAGGGTGGGGSGGGTIGSGVGGITNGVVGGIGQTLGLGNELGLDLGL